MKNAKQTILDLINAQINKVRAERNEAMSKVSSLRMEYIKTGIESIKEQMEDAECQLKVINIKAKALEEAELNIHNGFGW
jgi:uncharacterized coiled-coil DUF342 family protein